VGPEQRLETNGERVDSVLRVLCVDGDADTRALLVASLKARGVRVEAVSTATEALARLRAEPVDVLITDLLMPAMDGVELIVEARGLPQPPSCVLLAAFTQSDLDLSHLPLGTVAGVLGKPWTDVELWELVGQAARVNRRRSLPAQHDEPLTILFVEDDERQSTHIEALLRQSGLEYELVLVRRLGDALEVLAERAFDAALVDLNLPDARGVDAVRRIRTISPGTPVVALAEAEETWGDAAVDFGAQDMLVKSTLDAEQLSQTMRRALKRRHAERRAADLAFRDELTELYNARYFHRRLADSVAQSAREGRAVAVFLMDLDGFKPINDVHGHAVGDAALRAVATRLRETLREYDTLARLGGDEFGLLVHDVADEEMLLAVARRIGEHLARPIHLPQASVSVGVSIGVALAPACAAESGLLLRAADKAMYAAKAAGKGTVRFAARQDPVRRGTATNQAVRLPQLFIQTLHSTRERLVVWHRIELGFPDDPSLGTADVLRALSQDAQELSTVSWALRAALGGCHGNGRVVLHVPDELVGTSLLDVVRSLAAEGRAHKLVFELGGAGLSSISGSTTTLLQAFRDLGAQVVVRDFGSASMRADVVAQLPVHGLRLDSRLVARAVDASEGERLLAALVRFGQALGFELIAEDLHTDAQLAMAARVGTDRVFSRFETRVLASPSG